MTEKRVVPGMVKASIALQIVGSVLALVAGIVTTAGVNAGDAQIWVLGLVVAISLYFAQRIHAGSRAVRVLMSVIAVLNVLLIVFDLVTGELGFTLLDVIAFGIWDVAVLLLWLPASRPHFAAKAAADA